MAGLFSIIIPNAEDIMGVLLDHQKDRPLLLVNLLHNLEDLPDQKWSQAQRGLVHHQEPGLSTSDLSQRIELSPSGENLALL